MKKNKMVYLVIGLLIICLEFVILYQTIKINRKLDKDYYYEINDNITQTDYYVSHNIGEDRYNELFSLDQDFVLYFRSDNCEHCQQCDKMVFSYLNKNYDKYLPIYFAEYDTAPDLFDTYYDVEVTPTMILFSNQAIVDLTVGYDECFELLDNIVQKANT